jgi:chemosensory pili system protein ChpE
MDTLILFAGAFAVGLLFNAAPGAVFAETVRVGLRGGFRPAFAVQVGSLAGDAFWALLGLGGVATLAHLDLLHWPLGILSAGYLAWLSWDSWRSARTSAPIAAGAAGTHAARRALRSGVLLSLTNPQNIAYWAALGSAMAALGLGQPQPGDYAVFFGGFMLSSLLWCFICAALVSRLHRMGGAWVRVTYRVCAAMLLALAIATLRDLWERRLPGSAHATPPALSARP